MGLHPKPAAAKRRGKHPNRRLTDAFCRTIAEAGRHADGNGL